ncbi:MAG: FAM151 family protein [Actinomycetia bacterium]|nr:FAM151 family protein [Actinomycetes bacterium]MCP4222209.1 FAM151 family protein [Actinomycetes bacterium]MCP5030190.1 FAM151 family protein [Actinomycetes bacterium]
MLDHVFTDAIGALRDALESAMLERQAFEERFQADVLLGDVTWETSYGLPGEGSPPRVQADLTLEWPTWAQTAYRTWYLDEEFTEGPRIEIEVVFRVQRLAEAPDPAMIMKGLPESTPSIGDEELDGFGPTLETDYDTDLIIVSHAVEITYKGSYELDEKTLEDGSALDEHFGAMGGWIASALVRLGDLPFSFQPAVEL